MKIVNLLPALFCFISKLQLVLLVCFFLSQIYELVCQNFIPDSSSFQWSDSGILKNCTFLHLIAPPKIASDLTLYLSTLKHLHELYQMNTLQYLY